MHILYSDSALKKFMKRARISLSLGISVFLGGHAACIILCLFISTRTSHVLLPYIILTSVLSGWLSIGIFYYAYFPSKAQAKHISRCLRENTIEYEGHAYLHSEVIQIPKSIAVRKVALQTKDEKILLNLNAAFSKAFPEGETTVRVCTVNKYITAFEVLS